MAKKTTAKPKAKKVARPTRQRLKREENVEFMLETPEQAKEVCAHLAQLEVTLGWIYLKKMLKDSMLVIERQIITKKDLGTGLMLTDEEIDTLRMSYLAYEELINKPASLIENITKGNIPTAPQYDPYASIKGTNENFAGVLDDEQT